MYCATDGSTIYSFSVRRLADRWIAQAPSDRRHAPPAPGAVPADDEALRLLALDKMHSPRLCHLAPRVAALPPSLPGAAWAWVARANVAEVKAWAAALPADGRLPVELSPTVGVDDDDIIGWVALASATPGCVLLIAGGATMEEAAAAAEALGYDAQRGGDAVRDRVEQFVG